MITSDGGKLMVGRGYADPPISTNDRKDILCKRNGVDYSSFFLPDQSPRRARVMRAPRKYTSSPLKATTVQGIMRPNVRDKDIVQKCVSVVAVLLMPMTFIPKKLATKLIGTKMTVTMVNTYIALLLSSWNVSTSCTF